MRLRSVLVPLFVLLSAEAAADAIRLARNNVDAIDSSRSQGSPSP